jgi:Domain of unknown function (DUF2341)/Kelch motif/Secretion system C-terminal sorting domain
MQKNFYLFLFIIVIISSSITTINAQPWIGDSWEYRRLISISNPGTTVLTNYQVKIALINSTFNFNHAKNDGSDIRLTASDGTTLIPFWIEEWIYGTQATIWVNVPSIPTSGTTVYLYYGNNAATNASNGFTTFDFFDDFESWNITPTSIWQDQAPMPTPIADMATAVYNGKIYSFGGYGNGPTNPLNKNYVYDPVANTWTEKTPMPTARWGMAAAGYNGLIFVFGGSIDTSIGNITKNEVYDPVLNTWTTKASMPASIAYQGLIAVQYGTKIHLFYESYHYEYDPVTDVYTQKANVPNPRFWSTAAVVGTKIYLIGGYHGGVATNFNEELDPVTNTWTTKAPSPAIKWGTPRENPVINRKIYVTHGLDGNVFHTSNFAYDPATDTWQQRGPAAHLRDGVGGGVINNKLYIIGGRSDLSHPVGLIYNEVYDPSIDTFTPQPGPDWWATSGTSYVYANDSAKYQGNYGLVVQQPTDTVIQCHSQTGRGFGNVYALDFNWEITDLGGIGTQPKPQGLITLTETDNAGSLFFFNSGGVPVVSWYTGTDFNYFQNSTWNSWHKVTVIRNGTNSRVIFDGNLYQSPLVTSPPTTGTGMIKFGVYFATRQFLDNVRIRKWAGEDPSSTVDVEIVNPLPVELSSFTANISNGIITLKWKTTTEVNNIGFNMERSVNKTDWTKIAYVQGNGNSNSVKNYSYADNSVNIAGKYYYRLKQINNNGSYQYSNIIEADLNSPSEFALNQNYPNPFNPNTKISYRLKEKSFVKLMVYDTKGALIKVLVNETKESGYYETEFNAKGLASGTYFYRIEVIGNGKNPVFSDMKKTILLK